MNNEYALKLKNDLIRHEGRRSETYLDHLGYKTGGVGHLITKDDEPYWRLPIDTTIPKDVIDSWLTSDMDKCEDDCKKLFSNFNMLPGECQIILMNMAFNLGRTRLSKFKKLILAIESYNFEEASVQMKDSRWYRQVKGRAVELCKRMQEVTKWQLR